jgi:hypothetical protein
MGEFPLPNQRFYLTQLSNQWRRLLAGSLGVPANRPLNNNENRILNGECSLVQAQLQVREAVFVTFVPSPAGTVAIMIAAPVVAPLQVAVP